MTDRPMLALESAERKADPRVVTFGVLTSAIAMLVSFGALLGAWLSLRSGTLTWPPKGVVIQNYYGTTLSVTIVMAALSSGWGAYAVRKRERAQAFAAYAFTLVLGLAFLNLLSYTVHVAHFGPGTHPYGTVFFAFNIVMGVSIVAALVLTLVTVARFAANQVSSTERGLSVSTAWFWDAVLVGWFVMYAAVYLVK